MEKGARQRPQNTEGAEEQELTGYLAFFIEL